MAFDPNDWSNELPGTSPPTQYEAVEADGRWWFNNDTWADDYIVYNESVSTLPDPIVFDWEIVEVGSSAQQIRLVYKFYADQFPLDFETLYDEGEPGALTGQVTLPIPSDADGFWFRVIASAGTGPYDYTVALNGPIEPCDTSYNCSCEDDPGARTLASLRQELMARLGYAAQINNPPPGMTALLNSFLRDAQVQLYHRFTTFKTERFFTWPLKEGVRYYGLGENNDCCEGRSLDPYKITWVGVEDANGVWYPLHHGIPPEFYTMTEQWKGWPARYEIRECIEIFPAPSADMRKLRIKGHFGLRPFTEDEHKTTINPDVLFLWALGTAKSHYGQIDAGVYFQQANDLIGRLVAGSHQTARYIPGRRSRRPLTPPKFLPISED